MSEQAFDTANTYSAGESEVILGKFLKQHKIPRESVVILTKTFNTDGKLEDKGPAGWTNHRGLSRKVGFPRTIPFPDDTSSEDHCVSGRLS